MQETGMKNSVPKWKGGSVVIKRREFLEKTFYLVGFGAIANSPFKAAASKQPVQLSILHTNDWHSRIDPFPSNDKSYGGHGGAAQRASLINSVREREGDILLLDAGDIFQGTPYFNFYGGELEFKLMSAMGYDCVTLGNHDFDAGIEGLVRQMPLASFDFVNSNYDFSGTALEGRVKPYRIFKKKGIKVGVFGLGIELKGLVPDSLFGGIKYNDPIAVANKMASFLKQDKGCDLVICLSHLGYRYNSTKVSDEVLAAKTSEIDLILGGHTHTFLPEPVEMFNKNGRKVIVNQVGWAGLQVGHLTYTFESIGSSGLMHATALHQVANIQKS